MVCRKMSVTGSYLSYSIQTQKDKYHLSYIYPHFQFLDFIKIHKNHVFLLFFCFLFVPLCNYGACPRTV